MNDSATAPPSFHSLPDWINRVPSVPSRNDSETVPEKRRGAKSDTLPETDSNEIPDTVSWRRVGRFQERFQCDATATASGTFATAENAPERFRQVVIVDQRVGEGSVTQAEASHRAGSGAILRASWNFSHRGGIIAAT